jgi:hypothetical protein
MPSRKSFFGSKPAPVILYKQANAVRSILQSDGDVPRFTMLDCIRDRLLANPQKVHFNRGWQAEGVPLS